MSGARLGRISEKWPDSGFARAGVEIRCNPTGNIGENENHQLACCENNVATMMIKLLSLENPSAVKLCLSVMCIATIALLYASTSVIVVGENLSRHLFCMLSASCCVIFVTENFRCLMSSNR